jgi:hypothetical protein
MSDPIVKVCPLCGQGFSVEDLAYDPNIEIRGFSFLSNTKTPYYFFQHVIDSCSTGFMVDCEVFRPMIEEPIKPDKQTGSAGCQSSCYELADLRECDLECYYAPFRRLLSQMTTWKETERAKVT